MIKLSKEFEKLGEKRHVAKRIADNLQSEVKDFITNSVPLMLLICNQGMRERHWADIERMFFLFFQFLFFIRLYNSPSLPIQTRLE